MERTFEMVKPNEIGKTRTRSSYWARKENRNLEGSILDDVVDDGLSIEDKNCNFDMELNFSVSFDPTSIKEVIPHDEWINSMKKEYDALIKNGTWKLVDPLYGTKPSGYKWFYKNKYKYKRSLNKYMASCG